MNVLVNWIRSCFVSKCMAWVQEWISPRLDPGAWLVGANWLKLTLLVGGAAMEQVHKDLLGQTERDPRSTKVEEVSSVKWLRSSLTTWPRDFSAMATWLRSCSALARGGFLALKPGRSPRPVRPDPPRPLGWGLRYFSSWLVYWWIHLSCLARLHVEWWFVTHNITTQSFKSGRDVAEAGSGRSRGSGSDLKIARARYLDFYPDIRIFVT